MKRLFFNILCFFGFHDWHWEHNSSLDEEYTYGYIREVYVRHCKRCDALEHAYADHLVILGGNNIKKRKMK